MKKKILDDFFVNFKGTEYASKDEIRDFLSKYYTKLSNSSFLWKLFELKEKGLITKISNDKYQINEEYQKKSFTLLLPDDSITKALMRFNKSLDNSHVYSNEDKLICLWHLNALNSFTSHQYSKEIIFIEIDKYRIDELFFELKDKFQGKYYISKEFSKDYDHITLEDKIIIINSLVKRAPVDKRNAKLNHYIAPPKFEKILVDIIANKELFSMYDKASIKEMFKNYYYKYNLDFTTLLYYAKNRGIRNTVKMITTQALGVELDDN